MKLSDCDSDSYRDWSCGNALLYIFFSDNERASFNVAHRKFLKYQLLDILSNPDKNDWDDSLEKDELELIKSLANNIRSLPLPFKITKESQFSPIAWVKLAMQISFTGIPIANKFMRHYGKWRNECQHSRKLALVVQNGPEVKSTEASSTKSRDSIAYSLDVFLLTDIAKFNPFKYNYCIQYKAIAIDSKVATQKVRSKRLAENQVGTGVYSDFNKYITKAAEGRYIPNELRKLPDGSRFKFSGTRLELLDILRKKFPGKLTYSDGVCIRAISDFAACGKYKRSKRATAHQD